jgi:N-acetylmuramoyl-L-alanine amidase
MLRIIYIFLLVFIFSSNTNAADVKYHTAKVKVGENINNFLTRHQLSNSNCNIDLFCDINKIKNKNIIIALKEYKLPVKLYKFNGKSIRSTVGIKDKDLAKRIEAYNAKVKNLGIKPKSHLTKNLLWVPIEEIECYSNTEEKQIADSKEDEAPKTEALKKVTETNNITVLTPTTVMKRKGIKEIKVPLMGPEYEIVNIEDFSLEGQVYYIISGHGGPDPGAVCKDCPKMMCEDEYAYDVSLRLARNLMQHGATVHMIVQDKNDGIRDEEHLKCDNDEKLLGKSVIPLNQKKRLRERAENVNALYRKYKKKGVKIQKAIEIHVDSRNKNTRQDVFFYYNANNKASEKLANTVQEVFESKYAQHQKDRGYQGYVEGRGLYMVRNLAPTTLFVELANITNEEDHKRLVKNYNRQALANWLFEGLRK